MSALLSGLAEEEGWGHSSKLCWICINCLGLSDLEYLFGWVCRQHLATNKFGANYSNYLLRLLCCFATWDRNSLCSSRYTLITYLQYKILNMVKLHCTNQLVLFNSWNIITLINIPTVLLSSICKLNWKFQIGKFFCYFSVHQSAGSFSTNTLTLTQVWLRILGPFFGITWQ